MCRRPYSKRGTIVRCSANVNWECCECSPTLFEVGYQIVGGTEEGVEVVKREARSRRKHSVGDPFYAGHACPKPVSGGIVYIKYCVCKIRHLVLFTTTTTDGRQYFLNIYCMSTITERLSTGMMRDEWHGKASPSGRGYNGRSTAL